MPSKMKPPTAAAVLLLAILVWGCESSTEPPPAPAQLEAVQTVPDNLLGGLLGSTLNLGLRLVQTTVVIVGDLGDALIGPVGGSLSVDGHRISVPPGAVPHPATFTMEVLSGRTVEVDLTAVDPETGEDVGGKGFAIPVQLALSYDDVSIRDADVDRLVIVRIHEDGRREPLPSTVDRATKQVIAELDHFSKYGLCRN